MAKKGLTVFLTVACALACAISLSACANKAPETPPEPTVHTHAYQWVDNGDGTHKQHCSVAGCDAPDINVGDHVWGADDKCEKCKAAKPVDAHAHKWAMAWASDETHHWHDCTASGCDITDNALKNGYGEHSFDPETHICVCGKIDVTADLTFTEIEDGGKIVGYSVGIKSESKDKTEIVIPESYRQKPIVAISQTGFADTAMTTLNIPQTVTSIANYAFYRSKITELVIPDSVTEIGDQVFQESAITDIKLPNNLRSLGEYAFYKAENLTEIVIPDTLTVLPRGAFSHCTSLVNIKLGAELTEIGTAAFEYTDIRELKLEGKISKIGGSLAHYCPHLRSVTIGPAMKEYESFDVDDYRLIEVCNKSSLELKVEESAYLPEHTSSTYSFARNVKNLCTSENAKGNFFTVGDGFVFYSFGTGSNKQTYLVDYEGTATKITLPSVAEAGVSEYKIHTAAFRRCSDITDVVIPDGVTEIGGCAFQFCTSLKNITIGKDVASILQYAFTSCHNLEALTIPENVALMEGSSFIGMENLKTLTWNAIDCKPPQSEELKFVTTNFFGFFSASGATQTRDAITSVTFGLKVKTIPANAFKYCVNLKNVTIPSTVTEIGRNAFYRSGVQNVVRSGSKTTLSKKSLSRSSETQVVIGESAFENCADLQNAEFPDGVNVISKKAFYNCAKLNTIDIPDSVTTIGENAFYNCSFTALRIPDSVTDLGASAFCYCKILASVHIGAGVNALERSVFEGCTALSVITASDDNDKYTAAGNCLIETASKALVMGCKTSVIPTDGNVTSIGNGAFAGCNDFTSITIPDSVTDIGESAFADCGALQTIDMGNGVKNIGSSAFYRCSAIENIVIPVSVTSIGNRAFYFCGALKTVSIPESVTSIGDMAFSACASLESFAVDSKNSVYASNGNVIWEKETGKLIFARKNAEIPNDGSIKSIGSYAFLNFTTMQTVVIPDGITEIGVSAFQNCFAVTEIALPASIKSIGSNAFANCSALSDITFGGTKEQWEAVEKDAGWNGGSGDFTVHCTDGDI